MFIHGKRDLRRRPVNKVRLKRLEDEYVKNLTAIVNGLALLPSNLQNGVTQAFISKL